MKYRLIYHLCVKTRNWEATVSVAEMWLSLCRARSNDCIHKLVYDIL
jgi:hypothetical protein